MGDKCRKFLYLPALTGYCMTVTCTSEDVGPKLKAKDFKYQG